MPTIIRATEDYFVEESSGGIEIGFTDVNGRAAVPHNPLTWTLTNALGGIVNSREEVEIPAAASVIVSLAGPDLALPEGRQSPRVITIEGTYDSEVLGPNQPIRDQLTFFIENLIRRPQP